MIDLQAMSANDITDLLRVIEEFPLEVVKESIMGNLEEKLLEELQYNGDWDGFVDELVKYIKTINPNVCEKKFRFSLLKNLATATGIDGYFSSLPYPQPRCCVT